MCVAAAIGGAALAGGVISAVGSNQAADTQASAANNAADIGRNEFNTITAQESPFMQMGYGAGNALDYLMGIGPNGSQGVQGGYGLNTGPGGLIGGQAYGNGADILGGPRGGGPVGRDARGGGMAQPQQPGSTAGGYGSLLAPFTEQTFHQMSPAYQFQLQQGQQGTLNADASGAGALSGAAQKDLMGYNQNLANTSFNTAFNQYQTQQGNVYNRLLGLTQLGQNAAANTGMQGTNLAGQIAQSVTNAGSAQAAGQVGVANSISGGMQSAIPWLMSGNSGNSGYIQGGSGDGGW